MKPTAIAGLVLIVSAYGCAPPPVAETFGSSPASLAICSFDVGTAFNHAQRHCSAGNADAELVSEVGRCDFKSGSGREYTFLTAKYPTLYNFRCAKK